MAKVKIELGTGIEKLFECKYCSKKYGREETLLKHMCKYKERHGNLDSKEGQVAYSLFDEINKEYRLYKTTDAMSFIKSACYLALIKFSRKMISMPPVDFHLFTNFLLKKKIPVDNWSSDSIYELYITDLIMNEPPMRGLERSVLTFGEWADSEDANLSDFYENVTTFEATNLIISGRISPWVLYLSSRSELLLSRLSEEQYKMISKRVDPKHWKGIIQKNSSEAKNISGMLDMVGL